MAILLNHEFIPGYFADYWRVIEVTLNKTKNDENGNSIYGIQCLMGLYKDYESAQSGLGALKTRTVNFLEPVTISELEEDNTVEICYRRIMNGECEEPEFWEGGVAT